jgi:hypothetical protein
MTKRPMKVRKMGISKTYAVFEDGKVIEGGFFTEEAAYAALNELRKERAAAEALRHTMERAFPTVDKP